MAEGTPLDRVQVVSSGARVQIPPSPFGISSNCQKAERCLQQSPSRSRAARCVLSHNDPLHKRNLMKASFQRFFYTNDRFARTLTNEQ